MMGYIASDFVRVKKGLTRLSGFGSLAYLPCSYKYPFKER